MPNTTIAATPGMITRWLIACSARYSAGSARGSALVTAPSSTG